MTISKHYLWFLCLPLWYLFIASNDITQLRPSLCASIFPYLESIKSKFISISKGNIPYPLFKYLLEKVKIFRYEIGLLFPTHLTFHQHWNYKSSPEQTVPEVYALKRMKLVFFFQLIQLFINSFFYNFTQVWHRLIWFGVNNIAVP